MKKILALVLALAMVFALAACGGTTATPAATEAPAASEEPAAEAEAPAEEPAAEEEAPAEEPAAEEEAPAEEPAAEEAAAEAGASSIAVCLASEPDTLDPALNSAVDGATLVSHLFSGLAKWAQDDTGALVIVPDAATELVEGVENTVP